MKRIVRLSVILIWMAIQIGPMLYFEQHKDALYLSSNFLQRHEVVFLLALTPFLLLIEFYLVLMFIRVLQGRPINKRQGSRPLVERVFRELVIYLVLLTYSLFLCSEWFFFSLNSRFLTVTDLPLLSFLTDVAIIRDIGGSADSYISVGWILCAALPLLIRALAHLLPITKLSTLARELGIAVGLTVAIVLCGYGYFGAATLRNARPYFTAYASPQWSLIWSKLVVPRFQPDYTPKELEGLAPAISLEEYKSAIPNSEHPNVILLVIEALRADMVHASMNEKAVMPNLLALANDGYEFTEAYAPAPETDYSTSTILTGQLQLRGTGRNLNYNNDFQYASLHDLFKTAGYHTAHSTYDWMSTKRLIVNPRLDVLIDPHSPLNVEAQELLPGRYRSGIPYESLSTAASDRLHVEMITRWIDRITSRDDQPFFAYLFLIGTHFPYDYSSEIEPILVPHPPLPEGATFFSYPTQASQPMRQRYANVVHSTDRLIGEFVAELSKRGLYDSTTIVVTGDHGELFEGGNNVTHSNGLGRELLHVPLIVKPASTIERETNQTESAVGLIDIAPSLLDLSDLPPFNGFQGESLFSNRSSKETEAILSIVQTHVHMSSLIRWPYQLLHDQKSYQEALFRFDDNGGTTQVDSGEERDLRNALSAERQCMYDTQLSYYASPLRRTHYPPSMSVLYDRCHQ